MDRYLTKSSSSESLSGKRRNEDDISSDWAIPKRPYRPRQQTATNNIRLGNKFTGLPREEVSDSDASINHHPNSGRKLKANRIPPIIIEVQKDWTHQTITELISKHTKGFHMKYKNHGKIAIYCNTTESHQNLNEGLRSENALFHTYTRKEDRAFKLVIQGLPSTVTEDVSKELDKLGFNGAVITKLKKASGVESSFPPLLVQLPAGTDIAKFKQTKYICSCVIRIQKFRPNNSLGTQCYRCQRFGHSSSNCNMPERCVKCTDKHASKDCPKTDRSLPARCCNCNEDHPANYSKCKERISYIQYLESRRNSRKTTTNRDTNSRPSFLNGRSYSEATVSNNPRSSKKTEALPSIAKPEPPKCHELGNDSVTTEMLNILTVIKNIKDKYVSCTNMMDKVILILSYLGQYIQ